ncbi:hypothetical protein WA158_004155 [Blastocystis sp. Blastoise]
MEKPIQVDVYFDYPCPFCYVGKRRFEQGIKDIKAPIKVVYHSYQIDPSVSVDGEDRIEYNDREWGGNDWAEDIINTGRKEGIPFKNWSTAVNSLNAQRLTQYCHQNFPQLEDQMMENVFYELYENGSNISSTDVLERIAKRIGLPDVTAFINGKEMEKEVLDEDKYAKNTLNIHTIPSYVVNNNKNFSGMSSIPKLLLFLKEKYN